MFAIICYCCRLFVGLDSHCGVFMCVRPAYALFFIIAACPISLAVRGPLQQHPLHTKWYTTIVCERAIACVSDEPVEHNRNRSASRRWFHFINSIKHRFVALFSFRIYHSMRFRCSLAVNAAPRLPDSQHHSGGYIHCQWTHQACCDPHKQKFACSTESQQHTQTYRDFIWSFLIIDSHIRETSSCELLNYSMTIKTLWAGVGVNCRNWLMSPPNIYFGYILMSLFFNVHCREIVGS